MWRCVSVWWGCMHRFCMGTLLLVLLGLAGSSLCLDLSPSAGFLHGFFVLIVFPAVERERRRLQRWCSFRWMKRTPIILALPKHLVTSWSPWQVQLVATVSCAGLLPARYHGLIQLLVGICSCPQIPVMRVICWFPFVVAYQQNEGCNLKQEVVSPPSWCEDQPGRKCVVR